MIENSSIRKACEEIGIAKSTIADRFKKNGYTYSVEKNKYVKDPSISVQEIKSNKNITKVASKKNNISDLNIDSNILNDVKEIIKMKEDIKKLIEIHKADNNKKELRIRGFKGNLSVKTMKVYDEVLNDFMEFVGKNKEFKQQEIITQALWEFLQKYK